MSTICQRRSQRRQWGKLRAHRLRHVSLTAHCTRWRVTLLLRVTQFYEVPGKRSAAWQKTGEEERMNESDRRRWDIPEEADWA